MVLNKTPGSKMYGTARKKVGLYRTPESQYIGAVSSTFQIVYCSKSCEIRFSTNSGQPKAVNMFISCSTDVYFMGDKDECKSKSTAALIFAHCDIEEILSRFAISNEFYHYHD